MTPVATAVTKKQLGQLLAGTGTLRNNLGEGKLACSVAMASSPDQAKWDAILEQITQWDRNPEDLSDEGITPPTSELLRFARKTAERLRDGECAAPSSIALNGEGGVAFSWRRGSQVTEIDLQVDGKAELLDFRDGKLIDRQQL